jgi:hypothetical protein
MKKKLLSIIALFFLFSLCVHVGRALADVAANTQIVNQATLSYNDGSGTQTVGAAVTVTVAHVPGIPTLNAPADGQIAYVDTVTPLTLDYTITAGGNGPDTYTITGSIASQANNLSDAGVSFSASGGPGETITITGSGASIDLGATITTTGSTTSVLHVPADGVDTDGAVNGIAVDDIVVVNGGTPTRVTAISDPVNGTATITLADALSTAPGAGVTILEQGSFVLTVTSGTIDTAGTDIVVTVDTTAVSTDTPATDTVIATYTSGSATLTKYVRNVTSANGTTGERFFTVRSTTSAYYTGGVTGAPGDTLEYLLLVDNPGGGAVTDCTIDDVLPTEFVTFVSDAYDADEVVYVDMTGGTETQYTQASGDDPATLAGADLTVHVGTGATSAAGGTVPGSTGVFIVYQVTINN